MSISTRLLLIFLCSFCISILRGQNLNPYNSIGKKGKVLTSYNGKYNEAFDYDTIQRIGSVLINIKSRRIVKLLDINETFQKYSDNSTSSRWFSIDPLANKFTSWSPYNFVLNNPILLNDPDGRAPPTDYYNLDGKQVKHVDDGKTDKVLVLTTSKKQGTVDAAIDKGNTMAVPSNETVGKMQTSYDQTEKTGKEQYFEVGKAGQTSDIVPGESTEVTSHERTEAREDLASKGDSYSYDVHSHPNDKDESGNFKDIGTPTPSSTDVAGARATPDVILGYTQTVTPPPSNTIGGSSTVETNRTIGFYNNGGSIITLKFDDFKSAVSKINKN